MPPKSTQAIEEAILALSERLSELHASMEVRHDSLAAVVAGIQQQLNTMPSPSFSSPSLPLPNPPPPPPLLHSPTPLKLPKLHLPPFDGSNPLDWLFQAEQFFAFYQVPPEQRLDMVSFYMQGDALGWFKWMFTNRQLSSWDAFVRALELRFGPSTYDNHQATLFKLCQRGTVTEFQADFERLCNCVLAEAKCNDIRRSPAPFRPAAAPPLLPAPPSQPPLPVRRLSAAKLQSRRAQGLCFNCDEKFAPGHKCKSNQFLLLLADDSEAADFPPLPTDHLPPPPPAPPLFLSSEPAADSLHFQLSDAAFSGPPSSRTLCLRGNIFGHGVTILIDSGSSHNILQPRLAAFLCLTITPTSPFPVIVGNGASITCAGFCPVVPLQVQSYKASLPFYLFPIHGADVVLGAHWLSSLGPFLSDYSIPSMQFYHNGVLVTLAGSPSATPDYASFHQLQRLVTTKSIHSSFLLSVHSSSDASPSPDDTILSAQSFHPDLYVLLTKFQHIFLIPHGLPPPRPQDHHIHILPHNGPVNVKPYRYPQSQKLLITKLISDMLREGIIRPSTSPYSSPVLLIRKKDGSWRFCVDYRALNAITVRHRFPIPTVDELLDELHGASVFSKLDLRAGYHQIRLAPEDTHKTAFRTVDGHFEFLVMPFGLSNAPSTFQAVMNGIFRPFLRSFVLVFFDDILVYSKDWRSHLLHLKQVLQVLSTHSLFAKLSKCLFGVRSVEYLGHIISMDGLHADPSKLQVITDWPIPTSLTAHRGFLGLTGYYRRFVKHYATISVN
ncbi:UNVERIFIED_CONTAM: Retrovirus-related Pol polyprotein from transposon.6 [Sesamum radiatum]|uniref:Retrovirus-related Pol polyprotein from transposon.6 n=1 Tax=Sesamum radiatum TaxID=300843 RepID=A0AAW2LQG4_SESRA